MKTFVLTDDCQMKLHCSTVGSGNANTCLTGDSLESGKCYVGKPQNSLKSLKSLETKTSFSESRKFYLGKTQNTATCTCYCLLSQEFLF